MARKNRYQPQVHPVTNTMPQGNQVGKLIGKLNIAMGKQDNDEDKEQDIVMVINGNCDESDKEMVWDGNF